MLRKESLVPFEAEGVHDGVHCFFHAALDALRQAGFNPGQDMQKLRKDVKIWLRENFTALLNGRYSSTIRMWLDNMGPQGSESMESTFKNIVCGYTNPWISKRFPSPWRHAVI